MRSGRGGRGEYYKNKYGGGGVGRGGAGKRENEHLGRNHSNDDDFFSSFQNGNANELSQRLRDMDGQQYPAYKSLQGRFFVYTPVKRNPLHFKLCFSRIQSDPYASPSNIFVRFQLSSCCFPPELYSSKIRRTALCDYLLRLFCKRTKEAQAQFTADTVLEASNWSGSKGGAVEIEQAGQHVLERSSVQIFLPASGAGAGEEGFLEVRFTVGLPAKGRSIEGGWASDIFLETLPALLLSSFLWSNINAAEATQHVLSV